jgi:MFS family permease
MGVFLQGTAMQVGTLATLPPFLGAISQLVGMRLAERTGSRRQGVIRLIRAQALLCIPIALLPLILGAGWISTALLISLFTFYQATIGMIAPLWNSLVGDIIPPTSRGEFFGYRNKWMAILTFVGVFLAGQLLHQSKSLNLEAWGFFSIVIIAALARLSSSFPLRRASDPTLHVPHESKFSFWQFISRARSSNFVKFVIFVSCMNFGTAISGPYFAMYMLQDLSFSYHEYTLVVASVVLAQFGVMRSWGAISDQFGNRKILLVCGTLVSINPVLWLISSQLWFVLLIQLYSGIFWAGFNLAAANFVFDAVTPPKRARCIAYQAIINGVFVLSGSLCGALIATRMPVEWGDTFAWLIKPSRFLPLFVISAALRLFAVAGLLPLFKEVRPVEHIRGHELLVRITSLRPLWGATFAIVSNGYDAVARRKRMTRHRR